MYGGTWPPKRCESTPGPTNDSGVFALDGADNLLDAPPRKVSTSEHELHSQLNTARSASTQERVPDAYVTGFREREKVDAVPGKRVDAIKAGVGREARIKRAGEVRVVRQIVDLGSDLYR